MREKVRYRLRVLLALRPFAGGVKRFLWMNLSIGVLAMMLGFVQPLFYRMFIDDVILRGQLSLMPMVAAGYVSLFLMNAALIYLKNYSTNRLVNRAVFRVRMHILRGYFRRDFIDYERLSVGDMKMRLDDDLAELSAFAGAQTMDYVIAYATLAISALLLFAIEWRLALFSCITIPATFWLDHIIARHEAGVLEKQRENDQRMSSWLHASVQGWREIRALNLQRSQQRQFIHYIHQYAVFFGTWINYWVARVLVIPKIKDEFLMQFGLYFFGGLMIMGGQFEVGSLLVFMQFYRLLSGAIQTVSSADADLLSTMPRISRVLEELARAPAHSGTGRAPGSGNRIEFDDVSFTYPGASEAVIDHMSFHIDDGERVALVGPSGAGKTTVLKLMTGMLTPTSGYVQFSGLDIRSLSLDAMHRRFGFVMQENALFDTTIQENLLYAKPDATDADLEAACQMVYIWDFIQALPDRLKTHIGERGIKLSGGQKQRIVLARLLLQDAPIFIFDEATGALDQYSEHIVQDAIRSIGHDKTIIVVAHRQSSIALCERIIAL